MRDHFKKLEMEKLLLEAAIKAAKKGEALDPEMLNPARKRQKVAISEEEKERRFLLVKEWSQYKMEQHKLRALIEPSLHSGFYIESFSLLNHIETSKTVSNI